MLKVRCQGGIGTKQKGTYNKPDSSPIGLGHTKQELKL